MTYTIPPCDVEDLYALARILDEHGWVWHPAATELIAKLRFPAVEFVVRRYGRGSENQLMTIYQSFVGRFDRSHPVPRYCGPNRQEALEDLMMCVFFSVSCWDFPTRGATTGATADFGYHMACASKVLLKVSKS